ncbi:MAG: hydrogenase maturation protease [Deltaproteobacteria bacterium]|nr:hydrogenase maturation protease [Deltaproteobacteria bacterium]
MIDKKPPSILLYGFGNPGRQDDGLGVALVDELERLAIPNCSFEQNYQLNAEDALLISKFDIVIFVDASLRVENYSITPLTPALEIGFTTHAMNPASVVALCKELYGVLPQCYLFELHGCEWEMHEGISIEGQKIFKDALAFIIPILQSYNVHDLIKKHVVT